MTAVGASGRRRASSAGSVVNAPIPFLFPHGWLEFLHLNTTRGADPDSLYNVVAQFTGWGGFDGPLAPQQTPTHAQQFIAVAARALFDRDRL